MTLEAIDRVNAIFYGITTAIVGFTKVGVWVTVAVAVLMVGSYVRSRISKTQAEWAFRHVVWHVFAAGVPGMLNLAAYWGYIVP